MATKDEIKSLLEAEIGPLKAKLTSIEKSFSELEKSVKHFSAKYDELLKQVQRSNDRTASLSTDVKNLKEDMKQCKKIGREIEDLSQYLRRDCLFLNILVNLKIESKYYTIKQSGTFFQKFNTRGFSIFNCNVRSLGKNLCLVNDILITVKEMPSIIIISETKLNDDNQHLHNINIPGYNFVGVNSRKNAGGVGIYIKQNLNFFFAGGT